jgi:hypothetical protein
LQAAPSRVPQAAGSLRGARASGRGAPPAAEKKAEQESARSNLAKDKVEVEVAQAPAAPAATPAAPRAAAAPPAAERFGAAAAMRAANVVPDIVSPDSAVRWRIAGAAVQHSVDGGSTWNAVTVSGAADLTAGTAPAATVCWLVGRAGLVLLTTDGRTFRRLPFPEMTDLSGVRTVDAGGRVASVSTVDGRTFVTTDAGASWIPLAGSGRLRRPGRPPKGGRCSSAKFPAAPFKEPFMSLSISSAIPRNSVRPLRPAR